MSVSEPSLDPLGNSNDQSCGPILLTHYGTATTYTCPAHQDNNNMADGNMADGNMADGNRDDENLMMDPKMDTGNQENYHMQWLHLLQQESVKFAVYNPSKKSVKTQIKFNVIWRSYGKYANMTKELYLYFLSSSCSYNPVNRSSKHLSS